MTEHEMQQQANSLKAQGYCILELGLTSVAFRAHGERYALTGDMATGFLDYIEGLQQHFPGLSRIDAAIIVAEWFYEDGRDN